MFKMIFFFIIISIVGLVWFQSLSGAFVISLDTIKQYFGEGSEIFEFLGKFFILGSHPLAQISISLGILMFGTRLLFM